MAFSVPWSAADNIGYTPGAGATVATDEVGGLHYQKMKLVDGAPDSETPAKVSSAGEQVVTVSDVLAALGYAIEVLCRPLWLDPGTGRLRVSVDNTIAALTTVTTVSTVTTVTTVSTVTSLTQLAGFSAKDTLLNSLDRTLWNQSVRQRIS